MRNATVSYLLCSEIPSEENSLLKEDPKIVKVSKNGTEKIYNIYPPSGAVE